MEDKTLLLVEDDVNLGIVLKDFLEMEGFSVIHCEDGKSGLKAISEKKFQLAVLDIMLPYVDGFTLAEHIRKQDRKVPLIFLTARTQKEDRIKGFKTGADDYITKPFSTEELVLRINAVLRRTNGENEIEKIEIYKIGDYEFNFSEQVLKHLSGE
ncbi:MAG: response regulator transcription factor, partial [Bacteroidales bacterium]